MANDASASEVMLYTDGACSGNPGPGGWAYILRHGASGKEKSDSGSDPATTNNRMELTACIRGLQALRRPCRVRIVTDSEYVVKGMTEWMPRWKANDWRRKESGRWRPVKNDDLWKELAELAERHQVHFEHIAGHAGHAENERCDRLAVQAYQALVKR